MNLTKLLAARQEVFWLLGIGLVLLIAAGYSWWSSKVITSGSVQQSFTEERSAVQARTSTSLDALDGKQTAKKTAHAADVASIVASIPEASQFALLFRELGLDARLSVPGPFTVFASSNKAFAELLSGSIASMSVEEKKRLIEYHVVVNRKVDIAAMRTGNITALSNDVLNFETSPLDGEPRVNGASIVRTYQADNGIVYVIDQILQPPRRTY